MTRASTVDGEFGQSLRKALASRQIPNALAAEIRAKLAAPFSTKSAAAPLANTSATLGGAPAPLTGGALAGAAGLGIGLFSSLSAANSTSTMGLAPHGGALPSAWNVAGSSRIGSGQSSGLLDERLPTVADDAAAATADLLLDLLLQYDGGAPMEGLEATLLAIAPTACVSGVTFITEHFEPAKSTDVFGSPQQVSQSGGHAKGGAAVVAQLAEQGSSSPLLLAAQCLFLFTRHFQMSEAVVKGLCKLVEILLEEVRACAGQRGGRSDGVQAPRSSSCEGFSQHPATSGLAALTWLVTMSLVNALSAWRELLGPDGSRGRNALLRSSVLGAHLETWIGSIQASLDTSDSSSAQGKSHHLSSRFDVVHFRSSSRPAEGAVGAGSRAAVTPGTRISAGYYSIVLLAHAMLLCAKGDDKGLDSAVEAFFGDRGTVKGTANRGKVAKQLVQLAPAVGMVAIPMESIYIVPFEMLSAVFDDMLPALKHVADVDLSSYAAFVEDSQEEEDFVMRDHRLQSGLHGGGDAGGWHSSGGGGPAGSGAPVVAGAPVEFEPFSSEMGHVLFAITRCLEYLPAEVLNPDYDMDCAATFFIFKNFVTHLRAVFAAQRPSPLWEVFTFKIVAELLRVLAMIGRNTKYTARIVALLSSAQDECPELQWASMLAQAAECTGLHSKASPMQAVRGTSALAYGSGGGQRTSSPVSRSAYQHSPQYASHKQQDFVAALFMLLRQLAAHPTLYTEVSPYVSVERAIAFLFAPNLSQELLGSSLALLGGLIRNSTDAEHVWRVLDDRGLLRYMVITPAGPSATPRGTGFSSMDTLVGLSQGSGNTAPPGTVEEALSIVGHCLYESRSTAYPITTGLLHLVIALLHFHEPVKEDVPSYSTVIRFIAEDVMRGVQKRQFASAVERFTVAALAAAALTRAFGVRFADTSSVASPDSRLPFNVIMATSKAPADVTGEALAIIAEAAGSPNDLHNHQRAATRQCLSLIHAAVASQKELGIESTFTFDARTVNSGTFVTQLLSLAAAHDSLMANKALGLLLEIPVATASSVPAAWLLHPDVVERVITPFAEMLGPESQSSQLIHAPPQLALLDNDDSLIHSRDYPVEAKTRLVNLLILHSASPQVSLASWLFGYPVYGVSPDNSPGLCFHSIVLGATNSALESQNPALAVKYVRILYQMRLHRVLNTSGLRKAVSMRQCPQLFAGIFNADPRNSSPAALSKHGYLLKLLALEVFQLALDDGAVSGNSLVSESDKPPTARFQRTAVTLPHSRGRSIALGYVQLLLKLMDHTQMSSHCDLGEQAEESTLFPLLLGYANGEAEAADTSAELPHGTQSHGRQIVDFARWPQLSIGAIPAFPSINAPGGAELFVTRTVEGAPQYSIPLLLRGFQQEQAECGRDPLTADEMRSVLRPFVDANACLVAYAAAVQFVEGWCDLLEAALALPVRISLSRLLTFVELILDAFPHTSSITVAAQEQLLCRLSRCIGTLLARVSRSLNASASFTEAASGALDAKPVTAATPTSVERAATGRVSSSISASSALFYRDSEAQRSEWRRPRSNGERSLLLNTPRASTFVQPSSLGALRGGSQLIATSRDCSTTWQTGGYQQRYVEDGAEERKYVSSIITALLAATVQLGPRTPPARFELHQALLLVLSLPGSQIDDFALRRHHQALFAQLVDDVARPITTRAQATALGLIQKLLVSSSQMRALFSLAVGGSSLPLAHSLSPAGEGSDARGSDVGELHHAMPPGSGGSGGAASVHLVGYCSSVLELIDSATVAVIRSGVGDFRALTALMDSVFDVLCVLTIEYPWQVYRAGSVNACVRMRVWEHAMRVVLGHAAVGINAPSPLGTSSATNAASAAVVPFADHPNRTDDEAGFASGESSPLGKEVLKHLLLCTTRWFSAMLTKLPKADEVVEPIAQFIKSNHLLLQIILSSPQSITRHGHMQHDTAELLSQITGMLDCLAQTFLGGECRALTRWFALPDLMHALASSSISPVAACRAKSLIGVEPSSGNCGSAAKSGSARRSAMDDAQAGSPAVESHLFPDPRLLALLAVRNIALFIARTECQDDASNDAASSPRLLDDDHAVNLVIRTTVEVVEATEDWCATHADGRDGCVHHLLALHALVLLLHSFAVRNGCSTLLSPPAGGLAPGSLRGFVVEVLSQAQDVVHDWFPASGTDFLRPPQMGAGAAQTGSPTSADTAVQAGAHGGGGPSDFLGGRCGHSASMQRNTAMQKLRSALGMPVRHRMVHGVQTCETATPVGAALARVHGDSVAKQLLSGEVNTPNSLASSPAYDLLSRANDEQETGVFGLRVAPGRPNGDTTIGEHLGEAQLQVSGIGNDARSSLTHSLLSPADRSGPRLAAAATRGTPIEPLVRLLKVALSNALRAAS